MDAVGKREIELVRELLKSLKPGVNLKRKTWVEESNFASSDEAVLVNFLLGGDKGFSVAELFVLLKRANLEFIRMKSPADWDLKGLFGVPPQVLAILGITATKVSPEQQLQLFELFHPVNRLLDFWCGHPKAKENNEPQKIELRDFLIYLHPQLRSGRARRELAKAAEAGRGLDLSEVLGKAAVGVRWLDHEIVTILHSALDDPKTLSQLAERHRQTHPVDFLTLHPITLETAVLAVEKKLSLLEKGAHIMYERLAT
jgi:hypothetical protein